MSNDTLTPPAESDERAARLRAAAEQATPGPWVVHVEIVPLNEHGRETFKDEVANGEFPVEKELHVFTEWDHPQLKGPELVVSIWNSPYFERPHGVFIREKDAAYIAAANPQTVLALLDERDALRQRAADAEQRAGALLERAGVAEDALHTIVDGELAMLTRQLNEARERAAADDALIAQQHVDAMTYRDERDAARQQLADATARAERAEADAGRLRGLLAAWLHWYEADPVYETPSWQTVQDTRAALAAPPDAGAGKE